MSGSGLAVDGLTVSYPLAGSLRTRRQLHAVRDVSFQLERGETLGVVGESGCGKSSLARALVRLAPVSKGTIHWDDADLTGLNDTAFRAVRPDLQMVFQDPFASLNPRMRMRDLIAEPLVTHRKAFGHANLREQVEAITEEVGLRPDMLNRFPHEFSGGQAQRIGIARAAVSRPGLMICDEAVSALDTSVRALILTLLNTLQQRLNLAMLFISHDLAVVRQVSDRVMVLYLGKVVEIGPRDALFDQPIHPYTQLLIGSVLSVDPTAERHRIRPAMRGELPSPADPPSGCVFRTRCPRATAICASEDPPLRPFGRDHLAACHHPEGATT